MKLKKGSAAAKAYMAKIRAKRKKVKKPGFRFGEGANVATASEMLGFHITKPSQKSSLKPSKAKKGTTPSFKFKPFKLKMYKV